LLQVQNNSSEIIHELDKAERSVNCSTSGPINIYQKQF